MIVFDSEKKAVERFKAFYGSIDVLDNDVYGPHVKSIPDGFSVVRTVFDLVDIKQLETSFEIDYDKTLPILFKKDDVYLLTIIGGLPTGKDTEDMINCERLFVNHHIPMIDEGNNTDESA